MSESASRTIADLLADNGLIEAAMQRAMRKAVREHALLGNPVATWRDGKVVWLQPEETLRLLAETEQYRANGN